MIYSLRLLPELASMSEQLNILEYKFNGAFHLTPALSLRRGSLVVLYS